MTFTSTESVMRSYKKKLRTSGAVLITGPKWCGKTWTALNAAESVIYMQDPDKKASYLKLASNIDTERFPAPSFLMVLTGGEFAYRRNDGVYVVPLGCLKD